jgi:cytochrome c-type biogenesis protein CcmE
MQGRAKFLVGGVILLGAVVYLIVGTLANQQEYFITVDKLKADQAQYLERSERSNIRISGVVLGDTITYDGHTLEFVIAHIPDSIQDVKTDGGLADILHESALNPNSSRITVVVVDQPKPDLLKHEAQAIVSGKLGEDGKFYADELLLKCPTRYEDEVPDQAGG